MEYITVDDAVQAVLQQGRGALLVKRDLKDAFRHIAVATSDQWLLGLYCGNAYWKERYLPFGLRTSPFIFDLFAKAVNWIMIAVLLWDIVLHYLDDCFAILPPQANVHAYSLQFDDVYSQLGLLVNHTKDKIGTVANFLGTEMDTILMQARLSQDKLARARSTVDNLLQKRTIPHRELESAIGFLSFAAMVVIPGRAFLRRLFDAIRRPTAIIRITNAMRADLLWWKTFLEDWTDLQLLRHVTERHTRPVWTDASGTFGMGGYLLEDCALPIQDVFSTRVPPRHLCKDIQFKEMRAVGYAVELWLDKLQKSRLILYCDNEACVYGLRKSSIKDPAMAPLRNIVMLLAKFLPSPMHWLMIFHDSDIERLLTSIRSWDICSRRCLARA